MDRNRFWEYVERARGSVPAELERSLRELLSPLSVAELVSFQQHFDAVADAAYTWDVYGAAIQLSMESDEFFDFRCTLIAHGRRVYEAAVRDPDSFSKVHERDADEAFGLVASGLYEERVGDMLDRYDIQPLELFGEAWDVDDPEEHARRLPLLYERYGRRKRWW